MIEKPGLCQGLANRYRHPSSFSRMPRLCLLLIQDTLNKPLKYCYKTAVYQLGILFEKNELNYLFKMTIEIDDFSKTGQL